jgi:hypothetical protein
MFGPPAGWAAEDGSNGPPERKTCQPEVKRQAHEYLDNLEAD